jgi:DNA-binding GntR family transcriptional regulator
LIRPLGVEDAWARYDLREVLELHALRLAWPTLTRSYEEHLLILQAVRDADRVQACDTLRTHGHPSTGCQGHRFLAEGKT